MSPIPSRGDENRPGFQKAVFFRTPEDGQGKNNNLQYHIPSSELFRIYLVLHNKEERISVKTFGPERKELLGWWRTRKNMASISCNITRAIKSRRLRWAGYAACMENTFNMCKMPG
jgi:hypothetical protein